MLHLPALNMHLAKPGLSLVLLKYVLAHLTLLESSADTDGSFSQYSTDDFHTLLEFSVHVDGIA